MSFSVRPEVREKLTKKTLELLEICQANRIPMFLTVVLNDTETGTEYQNTIYGSKANHIFLSDDKIEQHVLIANGFKAVPRRDYVSFDIPTFMENAGSDLNTPIPTNSAPLSEAGVRLSK